MWEKIFKLYVYYLFPFMVISLSLLYLVDGTNFEYSYVIEHRTEIGMIIFMSMTIYPLLYHSMDSISNKEWGKVFLVMLTIALMMLIVLKEIEVVKINLL